MECPACHSPVSEGAAFCPACGSGQAGSEEFAEYRYSAFISYRHLERDQAVARKVQEAIESYRLPDNVNAPGALDGRKLGKCYRDEDELAAAPSLPDRIREALRRSSALIVVCTPDTPQSDWVKREIETFAELHGRDRIFAALADGSSDAALPRLLKTRLQPKAEGGIERVDAKPLAADFRPEARGRMAAERLRLIAAVAGCDFDDLARREQKRKRKRVAAGAATALAVAAAFAIGCILVQGARQDALVAESLQLAAESRQLFGQGDRYGAIEAALDALPASSSDTSRPLVTEAQTALEQAMELDSGSSPWLSSYLVTTENTIGMIGDTSIINEEGELPNGAAALATNDAFGYLAISDDEGMLTTYDAETGRELATWLMPDGAETLENGFRRQDLASAGSRVIVSNPAGDGMLACFDAFTGELAWSMESSVAAMALTADEEILDFASIDGNGALHATAVDVVTGDVLASASFESLALPELGRGARCAVGDSAAELYLQVGDTLTLLDLATGSSEAVQLAYPEAASLAFQNGTVVATTVDSYDGEHLELSWAVEAFGQSLGKLWEREGTVTSEMDQGDYITLVNGWPTVRGFTFDGTDSVIVTAGRRVLDLELATGRELLDQEFSSAVLDASPWRVDNGRDWIFIMCTDGTVTARIPGAAAGDTSGDAYRASLGHHLRWGGFCLSGTSYSALALLSDSEDRLLAYRTPLDGRGEPNPDSTFDELVGSARELLSSVAQ